MADYTRATETAERIVYRLTLPTNATEVAKAINAAEKLIEDHRASMYDDAITVEADEEEIRFIIVTKEWSA